MVNTKKRRTAMKYLLMMLGISLYTTIVLIIEDSLGIPKLHEYVLEFTYAIVGTLVFVLALSKDKDKKELITWIRYKLNRS